MKRDSIMAKIKAMNADSDATPMLPPATPPMRGKVGRHEQERSTFRVMYMLRWQKLYQEFMGAIDDTCKTAVPPDMQSACRPMFAKAEEVVDMMLHGYATDEICQRLNQCSLTFFD